MCAMSPAEGLAKALFRCSTHRIIVIGTLTVTTLLIILSGAFGTYPKAGTLCAQVPRPFRAPSSSRIGPLNSNDLVVDIGAPKNISTSAQDSAFNDTRSELDEPKPKPESASALDGSTRVFPPAPPADTEEYLAICKYLNGDSYHCQRTILTEGNQRSACQERPRRASRIFYSPLFPPWRPPLLRLR